MGIGSSDFCRDEESEASWLVEHRGLGSPWSQFTLRRYGAGLAATGVSASVALPRLLRRRLQDWGVQGCGVRLGQNFVSFGRQLESLSRGDAELFYGIDIFFGDNTDRASWLWYCRAHEWLLQLHKAVLEPLPAPPPQTAPMTAEQRWPGRPRFLGEESTAATAAATVASDTTSVGAEGCQTAKASAGQCHAGAEGDVESSSTTDTINHQLSLFLSNADGHVGLLCLPVPESRIDDAAIAVARWNDTCEVPLIWAGRHWKTAQDFSELRETALNMPDLLLLGLETELATALTPDWTWEKYPRGYGDAALPPPMDEAIDGDAALTAANEEEEWTGAGVGPLTPPAPSSPSLVSR